MKNLRCTRLALMTVLSTSLLVSAYGAPVTAGAAGQGSLRSGLIHWWTFNGNGVDSIGDVNIVPIGPVDYVDAVMGDGIVLNGSNTGCCIPESLDMQFKDSFSISAWAMLKAKPSGKMWSSLIFCGDDRAGWDPYALQVNPDDKMFFLTNGVENSASIDAPFPLKKFVLVTAVYNKQVGTQTLYLDGKQVAQSTGHKDLTPVNALVDNANPGIGIGTNNYFQKSIYNFGWDGIINDLRIYNRAISLSEVQQLYKLGVATAKIKGLDLLHQG